MAKASLPSSSSAAEFLAHPTPGAFARVVASTLLRSALIFPGLVLADIEPRKAVVGAVGASLGITAFVVAYVGLTQRPAPALAGRRGRR